MGCAYYGVYNKLSALLFALELILSELEWHAKFHLDNFVITIFQAVFKGNITRELFLCLCGLDRSMLLTINSTETFSRC